LTCANGGDDVRVPLAAWGPRRDVRPAAGAPRVVVPQIADQPYLAGRVAAGPMLDAVHGDEPTRGMPGLSS
jgi:hypothetical protein